MTLLPSIKPLAIVNGQPWQKLPKDLYIPPEALAVCLEQFEGPLDLLLYLIRKHNLDILDIPVFSVTQQYLAYIHAMDTARVELAAEYLVMAAYLVEIKSRLLLPPSAEDPGSSGAEDDHNIDNDPRAELVARLLEYQQFQQAALHLDAQPHWQRDLLPVYVFLPPIPQQTQWLPVAAHELGSLWSALCERNRVNTQHIIQPERFSTQARMGQLLQRLRQQHNWLSFIQLLKACEGRAGVVVTFLALLELIKEGHVEAEHTTQTLAVRAHEPL
ncbi:MAG: hypothetical protein RL497_1310 [Pseudomonadota bacterium]